MMYKAVIYTDDGSALVGELDGESFLSKNFQLKELVNNETRSNIKIVIRPESWIFIKALQFVRDRYGKPMKIQPEGSGYREAEYNKSVNGTADSLHLLTCAGDIQTGPVTDALFSQFKIWCEMAALKYNTQCELLRYPKFLHIGFGKLKFTNSTLYVQDKR